MGHDFSQTLDFRIFIKNQSYRQEDSLIVLDENSGKKKKKKRKCPSLELFQRGNFNQRE